MLILVSTFTVNAQTKVVDADYLKVFDIDMIHVDYNQDYKVQSNELFELNDKQKAQLYIDYKNENDNFNTLYYKIIINEKGKEKIFDKTIRNVLLMKNNDGIVVGNKMQELQFGVINDSCHNKLFISNPALLIK